MLHVSEEGNKYTAWVVASGEQDTTSSLLESNNMARRGRRQNTVLSDEKLLDTVGSADFGN